MTIEVGYRYVSNQIVVGLWDGTGAADPQIDGTPTVQDGVAITINGARFSASGNRVIVGGTEVTVDTETTTQIVTDPFSAVLESMIRPVDVVVFNSTNVESNHVRVTIQPASGQRVFGITQSFLGDPSTRLEAIPDLVVNDEIIVRSVTGTNVTATDVTVDANGTANVRSDTDNDPNVASFEYTVFDGDRRSPNWAAVTWDAAITQTVTPDVIGFTQAQAEAAALSVSMTASVVGQVYSDTFAVGTVVAQFPQPNVSVNIGSILELTLSRGKAPILAPDLLGLTPAQASAECVNAGVVLGTVRRYIDGNNSGLIVNQSVVAGTEVAANTVIDVAISSDLCPDVVGQTLEVAVATLTAANLTVNDLGTLTAVSARPAGTIVAQDPEADSVVAPLALVTLTISTGKARVRNQVTNANRPRRRLIF